MLTTMHEKLFTNKEIKEINVNINDNECVGNEGDTILQIARKYNIEIPTLCSDPRLKPGGSCRMCVVEIEGRANLMPSCAFKAADGMTVQTHSEKVLKSREERIKFLMDKYNPSTESPDSTGGSRLLSYANEYNVPIPNIYKEENLVIDNETFKLDLNKCIRCGICVKVTQDLQHCSAINFVGQPTSEEFTFSFDDVACVRCGNCIAACPVDALMTKKEIPYKEEEVTKVQATCQYCGVGCQVNYSVNKERQIVQAEPVMDALNNGLLCVKGRFGYNYVQSNERLQKPLIRTNVKEVGVEPEWREASWDEALELISKRMLEIRDNYGNDSIAFMGSGKSSNEAMFMHQKLARTVFGTNNIDVSSRLCHSTSVVAMVLQIGSGAMSNSIMDLETADVIFQIGGNAHDAHPVIGTFLEGSAKRGTKYIFADPRKVGAAKFADVHMQQNIGTDIALVNGMMHHIIVNDLQNKKFIEERTKDFESMWEVIKEYTPEYASEITGVPSEKICEAAELYAKANRAAITWGMGIAQRANAVRTVTTLINLALLCGQIGRPGTGVNPLRGQNNVQGSGDMGLNPGWLPGYQMFTEDYVESLGLDPQIATNNRQKFEKFWGVKLSVPRGLSYMEMADEAGKGKVKCIFLQGADPVAMAPNTNKGRNDYASLEFLVVQDLFMSESAKLADVVLPACSNLEVWGTVTNTERRIQLIRPVIEPVGESRPDYEVTLDLMKLMGYDNEYLRGKTNRETASNIMKEISILLPSFGGVTYEKIERMDKRELGVRWPIPADSEEDSVGTRFLYGSGFAAGKVPFKPQHLGEPQAEPPTEKFPLVLVTIRDLYQYDNGTMTKQSPKLNVLMPHGIFEISENTATEYGLKNGDRAKVTSIRGEAVAYVRVSNRIPDGQVYSDFHHQDTLINAVTSDALDPLAKEPELKACAVELCKVDDSNANIEKLVDESIDVLEEITV